MTLLLRFFLHFIYFFFFSNIHFSLSLSLSLTRPLFDKTHRKHLRYFFESKEKTHTPNWCETTGFESDKMPKNFIGAFRCERARDIFPRSSGCWGYSTRCILNEFCSVCWIASCGFMYEAKKTRRSSLILLQPSPCSSSLLLMTIKIREPSFSWIFNGKLSNRIEWIDDEDKERLKCITWTNKFEFGQLFFFNFWYTYTLV